MPVDNQYYVQQVWLGLLDAERLSRYYGRLALRFQRWNLFLTLVILLCSTGAAATLITELPTWVQAVLSLVVAAVAIWSYLLGYSKKAAVASVIRSQCSHLASDWRGLWADLNTDRQDIPVRIAYLQRKLNEITDHALDHGLADDALNEQCAKEAYESVQSEFAV